MEQEYSIKDLYNISLKATSKIEIGNKVYQKGETILFLDSASMSTLQQDSSTVSASGGKGNYNLVTWTESQGFNFNLGVTKLSPFTMSLLYQGSISNVNKKIPKVEKINPVQGVLILQEIPESEGLFLYHLTKNGYEKDENYTIEENKISVSHIDSYMVSYYYNKSTPQSVLFDNTNSNPIFKIEAFAEIKNNNNSERKELLIEMPRVAAVGGLSLLLGKYESPVVQQLSFRAERDPITRTSCVVTFI